MAFIAGFPIENRHVELPGEFPKGSPLTLGPREADPAAVPRDSQPAKARLLREVQQ